MTTFGVHSEVGKLRTVMVCRPGLAHQRLTPGNCRDLLFDDVLWVHEAQKDHYDFVLKMQDSSCWIYNGVTVNPMFWPARSPETLLQRAVYKFHPRFKNGDFRIWWGDSDEDFAASSLEGDDVMPIGNGTVLIGMGERTNRQAALQVAQQLFKHEAATHVIAALMPKSRTAMHLDRVFTFCDRDVVTQFREVVDQIRCYNIYPSDADDGLEVRRDDKPLPAVVKEALGLSELRVVETGGNDYEAQREQWDDGNNVVALEPCVVVAYGRNTHTNNVAAQGGNRSDHRTRLGTRTWSRRGSLHDLSHFARSRVLRYTGSFPGEPHHELQHCDRTR